MSIDESNAFAALNQLIMPNNMSPTKMMIDEQMLKLLGLTVFNGGQPMAIQTSDHHNQHQGMRDQEKPSPSDESGSSREKTPEDGEDSGICVGTSNSTSTRQKPEGWYECFTTTSKSEFEALIYSLYVIDNNDRKLDGWQYFECFNRLQNKCRFRVRCKKQDEFYIVEEKCGHNHGIEPVGQAGSHAGLPKTLREIVDKSYNENWSQELRTAKVEDEIRRLGLPPNPRLGRQIDNRIAYLRRVKNLNETKKIQDQIAPNLETNAMFNPQVLQMFLEQNGGSLSIEKDLFNQLMKNDVNIQQQQQGLAVENQNGTKMEHDDVALARPTVTITPDESSQSNAILEAVIKQQQQHQALLMASQNVSSSSNMELNVKKEEPNTA